MLLHVALNISLNHSFCFLIYISNAFVQFNSFHSIQVDFGCCAHISSPRFVPFPQGKGTEEMEICEELIPQICGELFSLLGKFLFWESRWDSGGNDSQSESGEV
jgi:hypothetical protein